MEPAPVNTAETRPGLKNIGLVFLKVGLTGFGGGPGMLALIRQEVVERRKWVDDAELATAVAMGQMLPGPFVSNYAEYIGYRLAGVRGMLVAATGLLLPGFVLMCALGFLYFRYGTLPIISRIFAGIQPVVVGILAWATWSIGRSNIKNWRGALIAALAGIALFLRGDVLLVVLGCGVLGILLFRSKEKIPPARFNCISPLALIKAGELALVFFKMGTVIFGGGFAAIPFLQHEVVELRGWVTVDEFLLAVALGQMTPGPVAIMATFIGYRVLGLTGALIATLGTFLPSGVMLYALIRLYNRIRENPLVQEFLAGVLPAVCGMLFFSSVTLGRSSLTSPLAAFSAVVALFLLIRFKIEPIYLFLGGAIVGLIASSFSPLP